jgi:hypothetical protein
MYSEWGTIMEFIDLLIRTYRKIMLIGWIIVIYLLVTEWQSI